VYFGSVGSRAPGFVPTTRAKVLSTISAIGRVESHFVPGFFLRLDDFGYGLIEGTSGRAPGPPGRPARIESGPGCRPDLLVALSTGTPFTDFQRLSVSVRPPSHCRGVDHLTRYPKESASGLNRLPVSLAGVYLQINRHPTSAYSPALALLLTFSEKLAFSLIGPGL